MTDDITFTPRAIRPIATIQCEDEDGITYNIVLDITNINKMLSILLKLKQFIELGS